jgi:hypothetical protein
LGGGLIFERNKVFTGFEQTGIFISNAYSLRQGRRQSPTSEVKELQFVIVIVNVKKEIKLSHWGGKTFLKPGFSFIFLSFFL